MALPHRRRSSPIKGGALMFPTSEEITTWMPELLGGLSISLQVTALSLLFGIPLGLVLALGVLVHNKDLREGSLLLVEIGRGAPALVLLQFIYFGLPTTGLIVDSFPACVSACNFGSDALLMALRLRQ